jgi:hypothetical protein
VARLTTNSSTNLLDTSHGHLIDQMDVKTTFLNGELEEDIYMEQVDEFVVTGQERRVRNLFLFCMA